MTKWIPGFGPNGEFYQSAMPKADRRAMPLLDGTKKYRGVVLSTYVYDATEGNNSVTTPGPLNAVYASVLLYGARRDPLPRVLVTNFSPSDVHSGPISKPRASTVDVTGSQMNPAQGTNPTNLDGSHVVVDFLEGDPSQPFIAGYLPHPSSDKGHSPADALGDRIRILANDGDPLFWKHRGAYFGVDSEGNFVLDLEKAHNGQYTATGEEPPAVGGPNSGNVEIRLPVGSTVVIQVDGGETLELSNKDGNAMMRVGDGQEAPPISSHLESLYTSLKAEIDALAAEVQSHVHPFVGLAPGIAGTTSVQTGINPHQAPNWDPNIASTKVTIPDN